MGPASSVEIMPIPASIAASASSSIEQPWLKAHINKQRSHRVMIHLAF
jgi:hypothetical protein